MKSRLLKLLAFVLTLVIIAGCQVGAGNDPKAVTKKFFEAMKATNFEEAEKLATKDSKMTLQLAQIAMNFSGKNKDSVLNELTKHSFDYGEPVINGDEATVGVTIDKKEQIGFTLRKEEGLWKMALDLNTLMKMGAGKMGHKENDVDREKVENAIEEMNADSMMNSH